MNDFPIPVRMVGPGSQPDADDGLQYLEMPRGMNTFQMPMLPSGVDADALVTTRDLLSTFLRAMNDWDPAVDAHGPQLGLAEVPAAALTVTNQMLGEGEVSIQVAGTPAYRIQESVFTGVWRVCEFAADGRQTGDWIEAGMLPRVAVDVARAAATPALPPVAVPDGAMNSPALLNEITGQMRGRAAGSAAHVINLTLFPMTEADFTLLNAALPPGPVAMMSRGFGNCRISSTLARDVWRVQYFNNMNTLILNTIEIVAVPEVAQAATEDLADSKTRLAELLEWIDESVAEQAGD
jgi:hydrogenase-1 operon protein HyaF